MLLLTSLALLVGNLIILGGALVWISRRLESVRQMAVDWHGKAERRDPTGMVIAPALPGVQGRLVRLETAQADNAAKLTAIDKELHPNSGTSFHDKMRGDIAALKDAVAELRQRPAIEASGLGFQAERAEV